MTAGRTGSRDPLRELARERGRVMGELGLRPDDARWARSEAEAVASLTVARTRLRLPAPVSRVLRRLARALR